MANAAVAAAGLGDNTVVAAVAGKRIRVHAYELSAAGATNAKWKSGAATDLTGLITFAAAGGSADAQERQGDGDGVFETAAGQALVLNLSAAVAVGGFLDYTLE